MIKSNKILEKVQDYYQSLRSKNQTLKLNNEEKLLENEKYLSTVNEIGKINYQIAKASYSGEIEKIEKLKIELENLQKIKLEIESAEENKTLPNYSCEICKDNGYVNGKRCVCFNNCIRNI